MSITRQRVIEEYLNNRRKQRSFKLGSQMFRYYDGACKAYKHIIRLLQYERGIFHD